MLGKIVKKQLIKSENGSERSVCDVCGQNHSTELCLFISDHPCTVADSVLPSRARLTLPTNFTVKNLADGTTTVVTKVKFERGTRFGPFVAPLTSILSPEVNFPLKIFGKSEEESYYLDTRSEGNCNWMCLVASATSSSDNHNLFCYQVQDKIFFSLLRDIEPGEELRVWYAPFYGVKMGISPERIASLSSTVASEISFITESIAKVEEPVTWEADTTTDDIPPSGEEACVTTRQRKTKFNNKNKHGSEDKNQEQRELEEKARAAYVAQQLPPKRLGARFTPAIWRCRECGVKETSVITYARHLMQHLKPPTARVKKFPCSLCHKKFFSQKLLDEHEESLHGLSSLQPSVAPTEKSIETSMNLDDPLPTQKCCELQSQQKTKSIPIIFEKPHGSSVKEGKNLESEDVFNIPCPREMETVERNSAQDENMNINECCSPVYSSNAQEEIRTSNSKTVNMTTKSSPPLQENFEKPEENNRKLVAVMGENSLQNLLIPVDQQKDIDSLLQSFQQPSHEKPSSHLAKVPETILNHEFFTRVAGDTVVRDVKSLLSMGYSLQFLVENEDGSSSLVDVLSTGRGVGGDQVTSTSDATQNSVASSQQLVIMASGNVTESVPLALQNILPPSVPIVPNVVNPIISPKTSLLADTSTNTVVRNGSSVNEVHLSSCLSSDRSFLSKQDPSSDAKSPLGTLLPSAITNSGCYDSVIPYNDSNSENTSLMEMGLGEENLEREELDYELGALELPLAVEDTNSTDYIMNACASPSKSNSLDVEPNIDLNTPVKLLDHCIQSSLSSDMMAFSFEANSGIPPASILSSPQRDYKNSVCRDGLTKDFSDLIAADAESSNVMLSIQPADSTAEIAKDCNMPSVASNNVSEKSKRRNSFEWLEGGLLLPAQNDSVENVAQSDILNTSELSSVEMNLQPTSRSKNITLLKDGNNEERGTLQVTSSEIRAELDGLLLDSHSNSHHNIPSECESQANSQHQLQLQSKDHNLSLSHTSPQPQCQSQAIPLINFHQDTLSQTLSQTESHHWLAENVNISPPSPIQFPPNSQIQTQILSNPQIQVQIEAQNQTQTQDQMQTQTQAQIEIQIQPRTLSNIQSPHQSIMDVQQELCGSADLAVVAEGMEMEQSLISSGPPFICDICNKTFGRVNYLYRHLRKHTGEFTCVACRAVFARKESLQLHECSAQPIHSGGNGADHISCPFCWKQFAAKKQLTRHIASHTGSRRFQYTASDRSFSSKEAIKQQSQKCSGDLTTVKLPSDDLVQDTIHGSSSPVSNAQNSAHPKPSPLLPPRCDLCRRMFSSDATLQQHKVIDHKHPDLQCEHCGRSLALASPTRAAQHSRFCAPSAALQAGNTDVVVCPECNEPFRQLLLYRQHVYRHTHPFVCAHCQRAFCTLQERGKHTCLDLVEQCTQCGHQCGTVLQLERHTLSHGVPSYHCFECGRSFHQVVDFNIHRCFELGMRVSRHLSKKTVDSENSSATTLVSSTSTKKDISQSQHSESKSGFMCEICGEVRKSRRSLKTHRLLHGERKIECGICGKRFHRRDVLIEHMYVHQDPQLRCFICNKLLKSKKSLDVHIRLQHSSHKQFICHQCGKEFHQKINLQNHMRCHGRNQEPVNCPDCGRRFASSEALAKHIPEHTEEPKFHCSQCDRSFVKEQKLNQHMKQHITRGFSCPACGHTLKHRNSLRRHVIKRHPEFTLARKAISDQLESSISVTQPQSPEVLLTVSQLQLTTEGVQEISVPEDTAVEDACLLQEGAIECSEEMVLYVLQEPLPCLPIQEST